MGEIVLGVGKDKRTSVLRIYAIKCAMHYHAQRLIEALQQRRSGLLNTF